MTEKDKKRAEEMGLLTTTEHVNHPAHYQGKRECIDLMRALFGDKAVEGFCKCNSFKYRFRAGSKAGGSKAKDLAKAEWYEEYLVNMQAEKAERK